MKNLSHIRAIVWDLDGTLYRYEDNFVEACNIAAVKTAIALGLDMTEEEGLQLARQSMKLYGNSSRLFLDRGIKYEDFHHPYHAAVDTTVLLKNLEMKTALEQLSLPMVILTNASRDWARRTVDHLDYGHLFPDTKLLALEDMGFRSKAQTTAGFIKALEIMGADADHTLMVEDLPHNLTKAKELGMTTALVHHHVVTAEPHDHVDHEFDDTLTLVKTLLGR